jgi:hypothetical protein
VKQLKYYIAPGAPPIRDVVIGTEPFMRPEVGFNPSWFYRFCNIEFTEKWHTDIEYRLNSQEKMKAELRKRFPGYNIGNSLSDEPPDLLTGVFGIGIMDSIFDRPLRYFEDKWPVPVGKRMTDEEVAALEVPNLNNNRFFQGVLHQVDQIYKLTGNARGFLNWQGNLNTAFRFRGDNIFTDVILNPGMSIKLFEVISSTYIKGVKVLHEKQREYGIDYRFATIANCTVNMVGPEIYENNLLTYDRKISENFECVGIHNCAWTVTPYLKPYSRVPRVAYIDMGIDSDLAMAKKLFPDARRNCLYTSWDLKNKSEEDIRKDFKYIADNLAPCDVGMPDIEADVPDEKIMYAIDLCKEFSEHSISSIN